MEKSRYAVWFPALLGKVGLLMILTFLTVSAYAQAHQKKQPSRSGTGEVVDFHEIVLQPTVDPAEFEKWVVEYFNPALEGMIPGVKAYVAKADRGVRKGDYTYIIIFDSYKTRQAYYPEAGKQTEHYKKTFFEPNKYLIEELSRYIDMNAFMQFTDWVVLR